MTQRPPLVTAGVAPTERVNDFTTSRGLAAHQEDRRQKIIEEYARNNEMLLKKHRRRLRAIAWKQRLMWLILAAAVLLVLLGPLAGCANMTPRQKTIAKVVVVGVVTGVVIAHSSKDAAMAPAPKIGPPLPCYPQPNGSCR